MVPVMCVNFTTPLQNQARRLFTMVEVLLGHESLCFAPLSSLREMLEGGGRHSDNFTTHYTERRRIDTRAWQAGTLRHVPAATRSCGCPAWVAAPNREPPIHRHNNDGQTKAQGERGKEFLPGLFRHVTSQLFTSLLFAMCFWQRAASRQVWV